LAISSHGAPVVKKGSWIGANRIEIGPVEANVSGETVTDLIGPDYFRKAARIAKPVPPKNFSEKQTQFLQ
jgi:hypothetical protein